MLRIFCILSLLVVFQSVAPAQSGKVLDMPIEMSSIDGLTPNLGIQKNDSGWTIDIDFEAQTNFPRNTWLKITNQIGSKIQLWSTNGAEMVSTNIDLLLMAKLPATTTVREVLNGVPRRWRGNQWLLAQPGKLSSSTVFGLQNYFKLPSTNDFVLRISPLIYRVETNLETAHLVEFPSMKLKLHATGEVEKVE